MNLVDPSDVIEQPRENKIPATIPMASLPVEQVEEDFILRTVKEDDSPDNVLKAVMEGLAEEQSSLKTLRQTKTVEGKDTSNISLKRGTLLKYMCETIIQRKAITGPTDELNIRGLKFREVFKMFLSMISETFDQVNIPKEFKDIFFQRLKANLEGWEDKAERLTKSMDSPKI